MHLNLSQLSAHEISRCDVGIGFRRRLRSRRRPISSPLFIQSDPRDLALRRSGSRLVHGAKARIDEEAVMPEIRNDQHRPTVVVNYRQATERDARAIAVLHADSWRRRPYRLRPRPELGSAP